ncbi:MAG: hypothetical protein Q9M35_05010 [Rhodothermus sp.]|nr:hypothetical protein [Rhodothermus sp.]
MWGRLGKSLPLTSLVTATSERKLYGRLVLRLQGFLNTVGVRSHQSP